MVWSLRTEASRYTCLTGSDAVVETRSRGRGTSAHHGLRTTSYPASPWKAAPHTRIVPRPRPPSLPGARPQHPRRPPSRP